VNEKRKVPHRTISEIWWIVSEYLFKKLDIGVTKPYSHTSSRNSEPMDDTKTAILFKNFGQQIGSTTIQKIQTNTTNYFTLQNINAWRFGELVPY
jgi:hypothetical protein